MIVGEGGDPDTHLDINLGQDDGRIYDLSADEKARLESIRIRLTMKSKKARQRIPHRRNTLQGETASACLLASQCQGIKLLRIGLVGEILSVTALFRAVQSLPRLLSLRLFDVTLLAENPNDWTDLAEATRCHPSLERVTLDFCQPSTQRGSLGLWIDAIINKVKYLALNNTQVCTVLDPEDQNIDWMQRLVQSTTLQSLKLERMPKIQQEHWECMMRALSTNQTLRELRMESSHLSESACKILADYLRGNPCLKKLELLVLSSDNRTYDATQPREIDWDHTGIAASLVRNESLTYLHIFAENISKKEYCDSFRDMLKVNRTLEHLILGWEGDLSPEIQFYIDLNKNGRKSLTLHARRNVWVEFMVDCGMDLSAVFYALTLNPSLVNELQPMQC